MDFLFEPMPTSRFVTTFIFKGICSPLDIAFQKISGLSRELSVTSQQQGGENSRNLYLANKLTHGSLVLERGVMTVTPLTIVFDQVMQGEKMLYADVSIVLLNHRSMPVCSWTVSNALPVRWQAGDLDANSNTLAINTLELRYQDMLWLGVKA